MNPVSIIIATATILLFSTFLTGCGKTDEIKPSAQEVRQETEVLGIVKKAEAVKKEVSLSFEAEKEEGQVKVMITLDNPAQKQITSIQSWLSFDPEKMKGLSVSSDNSDFELQAPYNNTFDNNNGLVMIGRSTSQELSKNKIKVAELSLEILGEGPIFVDAYDYRDDLSGHMSVNIIVDGEPFNILIKPENPVLVIEN